MVQRLYFLSKEVMLWFLIALKNPSSLARFEPANCGSSDKHDNHQTTEADNTDQEILLCLWNLSVYYRIHKDPPFNFPS
jgi:hypothetical protein